MEAAMSVTNMNTTPHAIAGVGRGGISIMRSQLRRAGPMAGLVVALLANVAWIGLLVYGLTALF
jgi:hypothetical protein